MLYVYLQKPAFTLPLLLPRCLSPPRYVHLAVVSEPEATRDRNGGVDHSPCAARVPLLQSVSRAHAPAALVGHVRLQTAISADEIVGRVVDSARGIRRFFEIYEGRAGVSPRVPVATVPRTQRSYGVTVVRGRGVVGVGDARSDHVVVGTVLSIRGALPAYRSGGDRDFLGAAHADAPDAVLSAHHRGKLAVQASGNQRLVGKNRVG